MKNHLEGFVGYVDYLSSLSHTTPNKDLIKRISNTTMVFGIIIDPSRDKSGRAQNVVGAIAHFSKALMFYSDTVFDQKGEILIGP